MKPLNKKALRAFAEKVTAPELVSQMFSEVESDINTVAVFKVATIERERLLTAALFNEQGAFAVVFIRETGEAMSFEIATRKFYKEKFFDVATNKMTVYYSDWKHGYTKTEYHTAFIDLSAVQSFLNEDTKNLLLSLRRKRDSFIERQKRINQKERSEKSLAVFKGLSPIPSNFKSWCRRDLSKIVFDTSDRKHGHCQYCDRDIEMSENMVQGRTYKCPSCHHEFKAVSLHSHASCREKCYSLYAELNGVPVIRHFHLSIYKRWKDRDGKSYSLWEYERDVMIPDKQGYKTYMHTQIGRYEYWRPYKKRPNMYGSGDRTLYWDSEKLYPYSDFGLLPEKLRKIAKAESHHLYRWEDALFCYPDDLELANIINAAGYSTDLAYGVYCKIDQRYVTPIVHRGRTPKEILGLDGNFAKLFKDEQYGYFELEAYNKFKKISERNSPQAFKCSLLFSGCSDYYSAWKYYDSLIKTISLTQCTVNQVCKYFGWKFDKNAFMLWTDYISNFKAAAEFAEKPLIGESWIFPPLKDIEKAHDEAYKWYQIEMKRHEDKDFEANEALLKKFVSGLASLDNYKIDGMVAMLPHSYGDFATEGAYMKHCVGGNSYFKAMAASKSIIVFLRHRADKSYCTCEFSFRDGKINLVQCRLKANKDAPKEVRKAATKYGQLLEKQLLLNRTAA